MFEPFAKDIWIAEGSVVAVAGFEFGTRMAIIRLPTNGLFVWSPIQLTPELKSKVDALGPVEFIVAPNAVHHLFIGEWAGSYPEALLFGPPGLLKKRPEIGWHGVLTDVSEPGWSADIDQVVVRNDLLEAETIFFHRASGTVIFTDLIQHFDRTRFTGWRAIVAWLDLMAAPEAEVPRKFRLSFFRSRTARAAIKTILQWPIERVLMAHGEPITRNGHEFVVRRFRWLKV